MCVLVVEDEPLIRLIVVEEFAEAGFEVEQAVDGDHAAALISAAEGGFSLLVTDIHMPGDLDGLGVARLFRRHFPDAPIIYTTGRPDALRGATRLGSREVLLAKPYVFSELLRTSHALLAQCHCVATSRSQQLSRN